MPSRKTATKTKADVPIESEEESLIIPPKAKKIKGGEEHDQILGIEDKISEIDPAIEEDAVGIEGQDYEDEEGMDLVDDSWEE